MVSQPIYDPAKTYQDNFDHGPFGMFADSAVFRDESVPRETFLGLPVHLPFGIPAGPLLNAKFVKAALDKGYDVPVYKTVRTRRHACHPWPNVLAVCVEGDLTPDRNQLTVRPDYEAPLSITNSFGVPSFDPEFWQPDIAAAVRHAGTGQFVVASFQGTRNENGTATEYVADFAVAARLLMETGVQAVEVNLSCPNEGTNNLLCHDAARSREVVDAIRQEIGSTALMIKCSYFASKEKLRELVKAVGPVVDGICAINTISAEVRDARGKQALPGDGRLWSGVCGAGILWAGLEMVRRLAELRDELGLSFQIAGCGGVSRHEDYARYRAEGADAVMSATGAMWNPSLAKELKALPEGEQL